MLETDPVARESALQALAIINATRQELDTDIPMPDEADPQLVLSFTAILCARALDRIDQLGGDASALLRKVYDAVTPVPAAEAYYGQDESAGGT